MKYKNTSKYLKKIVLVLCLSVLVGGLYSAHVSALSPPDNKKNYIYLKDGACASGDYAILNDDTECIRLRPDGKGYTTAQPGTGLDGKPLACGQNALGVGTNGSDNNPIFELISGPFTDANHHACLTITDPTYSNTTSDFWDIYTYSDRVPATASNPTPINTGDYYGSHSCGRPPGVKISIDLGCRHKGNPILDMLFAVIRFLSVGVGLVVIGSIIVAGIQYTTSRGDPQATAKALGRVYSTVGALLLFIFAYAILNWLVPGAILK